MQLLLRLLWHVFGSDEPMQLYFQPQLTYSYWPQLITYVGGCAHFNLEEAWKWRRRRAYRMTSAAALNLFVYLSGLASCTYCTCLPQLA